MLATARLPNERFVIRKMVNIIEHSQKHNHGFGYFGGKIKTFFPKYFHTCIVESSLLSEQKTRPPPPSHHHNKKSLLSSRPCFRHRVVMETVFSP